MKATKTFIPKETIDIIVTQLYNNIPAKEIAINNNVPLQAIYYYKQKYVNRKKSWRYSKSSY